jgi:hypothetical protein
MSTDLISIQSFKNSEEINKYNNCINDLFHKVDDNKFLDFQENFSKTIAKYFDLNMNNVYNLLRSNYYKTVIAGGFVLDSIFNFESDKLDLDIDFWFGYDGNHVTLYKYLQTFEEMLGDKYRMELNTPNRTKYNGMKEEYIIYNFRHKITAAKVQLIVVNMLEDYIEEHISNNFDFSFCSTIYTGTSLLCINQNLLYSKIGYLTNFKTSNKKRYEKYLSRGFKTFFTFEEAAKYYLEMNPTIKSVKDKKCGTAAKIVKKSAYLLNIELEYQYKISQFLTKEELKSLNIKK